MTSVVVNPGKMGQTIENYLKALDSIIPGGKAEEWKKEILAGGADSLPVLQKKAEALIALGDGKSLSQAGVIVNLIGQVRSSARKPVLAQFLAPGPRSNEYVENIIVTIFLNYALEAIQGFGWEERDEMIWKYPELVDRVNERLSRLGKRLIEKKSMEPQGWLKNCDPNDKKDISKVFWTYHKQAPHPDFKGLKDALVKLSAEDQRFVWWDVGVYLKYFFHQCYLQGLLADPRVDQLGSYLNSLLRAPSARPYILKNLHCPDELTRQRVMTYLEGSAIPQENGVMDLRLLHDLQLAFGFPGDYIERN